MVRGLERFRDAFAAHAHQYALIGGTACDLLLTRVEGVSVVVKARAWLDLKEREAAGDRIDSKDIRKHRNDVVRLYQIIDPAPLRETPPVVAADIRRFPTMVRGETIDLKSLGIARTSLDEVLTQLGNIYGVE